MTDKTHTGATAVAHYRARATAPRGLRAIAVLLQALLLFVMAAMRPALADPIKALGAKPGKAMPAVYAAIEGRTAGLPVYDSILLLGRESALVRLRGARARLPG